MFCLGFRALYYMPVEDLGLKFQGSGPEGDRVQGLASLVRLMAFED